MGYFRAGFEVVGVDNRPQPRYPFRFVEADALEYLAEHGAEYDVIHASPPCQCYCQVNVADRKAGKTYPDLVGPTRELLEAAGKPYVIENVVTAPLRNAVMLCGSSFALPIRRHRLFESSQVLFGTECNHGWQLRSGIRYPTCFQPKGGMRNTSSVVQVYGNTTGKKLWPMALGIDWMNSRGLSQAIPPCYTEFLGRQLLAQLGDNFYAQ